VESKEKWTRIDSQIIVSRVNRTMDEHINGTATEFDAVLVPRNGMCHCHNQTIFFVSSSRTEVEANKSSKVERLT
jgi:hypothetical protein